MHRQAWGWVIAASVLGTAAWWTSRPAQVTSASTNAPQVVGFAEVQTLEILWDDGALATLAYEPAAQAWILREPGRPPWPVEESRVRGGLRVLDEWSARVAAEPQGRTAIPDQSPMVTIRGTRAYGQSVSIAIASAALGGRRSAQVRIGGDGWTGSVDAAVGEAFVREGLRAWELPGPWVAMEARAFAVASTGPEGERAIRLERVRGGWAMLAPVRSPADAAGVSAAIDRLAGIRPAVARSADGAVRIDDASAQFEASMPVKGVVGGAGDAGNTLVQRLRVGGPADAGGSRVFVEASAVIASATGEDRPLWGPRIFIVERTDVERVVPGVESMLSRVTIALPSADVRRIALRAPGTGAWASIRRREDAWERVATDGAAATLTPDAMQAASALVAILSERAADRVLLGEPEGLEAIAEFEVGVEAGVAARGRLGVVPGAIVASIPTADGAWLHRAYAADGPRLEVWLRGMVTPEGP